MFTALLSWYGGEFSGPIPFNTTVTNIGDSYTPKSGVFQAKEAGNYLFYWEISTHTGKYCYTYLSINGKETTWAIADGTGNNGGYDSGSGMAAVALEVGDKVWIHAFSCSYLEGSSYSSFTGVRVA